jgi:hypothetical protein
LEDGSGHYLLESGTDFAAGGALLLEQTFSNGYSGLSVQSRQLTDGTTQVHGACRTRSPGLRPGHLFKLTSLNQGYAAASFQVTQVTTVYDGLQVPAFDIEFGDAPEILAAWTQSAAAPTATIVAAPPAGIAPTPALTPPPPVPGPFYVGASYVTAGHVVYAAGGGVVTIGSATFTVTVPTGHTLTVQLQGAIDARMLAWDNYVAVPRRSVRATISGGIYTGAWQELPFGLTRAAYDLSSAAGIALAGGTYTVSIQINTVGYNQMEVFSAWAQALVTTV